MDYWKFTSVNNWLTIILPENWAEYEDDEGTYAFFNTGKWSGNLRITPNRWANVNDKEIDKTANYIQAELKSNPNAKTVTLGKWLAMFYIKDIGEDLIYFWVTGLKNNLFLCSFSFDKSFENTDWHSNEIIVVTQILTTIEIIDQGFPNS